MTKTKLFILSALVCFSVLNFAQSTQQIYEAYISKYASLAQAQQKQYGIPASITLAQGLLESAAGRSELATKANNHFGIKCTSDWKGATFNHDDDKQDECFRKYKHASQSFEDHSKFLLRDRYKPLFDIPITDYKAWAHQLKKCGYATDPGYAGKLIKIIEDYQLQQYVSNTGKSSKDATLDTDKNEEKGEKDVKGAKDEKDAKPNVEKKADEGVTEQDIQDEADEMVQKSFRQHKTGQSLQPIEFETEHKVQKCNGRKFIVARLGDTLESIAFEYNIYLSSLRRFNDIENDKFQVREGDKIYLQKKRKYAQRKFTKYRVKRNETIWQIAQDKGMQLKSIYLLNGIEEGQDVTINQELRLRK